MPVEKITPETLFDRLATRATLLEGWYKVLANAGGPGGDQVSVHAFGGVLDQALDRLLGDLLHNHYQPGPVRRAAIPKRAGGTRPLAIPCVRDRVVQAALHELLEELLEPTFSDASFAYRPGRGVQQAIKRIQAAYHEGYIHVVDADIRRFFETVPHLPLLEKLKALVPDPRILRLVSSWLAQEPDARGLPQGAPISPILSNLYLDTLDDALIGRGLRLIRFADDFVILCKSAGLASETLTRARDLLASLGLELNAEKTRLIDFERGFRFLGQMFVKSFVMPARQPEDPDDKAWEPARAIPAPPMRVIRAMRPPDAAINPPLAAAADNSGAALPSETSALPALPHSDDVAGSQVADFPVADFPTHSPALRPIYLVGPGRRLTTHGEAFAVTEGEAEIALLAPRRVGRIEVGPEAEIDNDALRHALAWDIPVAFVSHGGRTLGVVGPPDHRHATIHIAQANAQSDPARLVKLACAFAAGRLRNQRALLNRLNRRRAYEDVRDVASRIGRAIRRLETANSVDAIRGFEGEAGALYWPALGRLLDHGFELPGRERRPPKTEADIVLNFAAAVLTRDIEALALRHGLHPGIAFLHASRDRAAPLAWDIIEPFRSPLVEGLVVYALNNRILAKHHFAPQDGHIVITPEGRDRFIRTYESWMSRSVRNHRRGTEVSWRGLIEDEVLALRESLTSGVDFQPYRMDY